VAKRIYPGNYVNALSGHLGQSVVAQPGRLYYHKVGYAKVDAVGGISFDVIIPSPDKRTGTDKQQPDITGMVVPVGASLYHLGIRVVDARKDKGVGTAFSGLVGTNADEIKLASAVSVAGGALTATTASTPVIAVVGTTITPHDAVTDPLINNGVIITGSDLTLKVYVENGSEAAGNTLSSSLGEGSYIIAECAYVIADETSHPDAFGGLPSPVLT
jgi:hypothetical protein